MIAQRTLALISYNDSNKDPGNRDYALANRLANYLRRNGVDAEIKSYSTTTLNSNTHQWLILIPSSEIVNSDSMKRIIKTALDQVVERRMKGVLAVTTGSDLPAEWATIRKYDASNPGEEDAALQGVWRAMQYAKIPYTEARALDRSQEVQQASASQQQQKARIRNAFVFIAAIIVIVAALAGVALLTIHPTSSVIILPPTVPPAQQGYSYYTQGKPTIEGFQSTQWANTTSCKFDKSHPPNYHATIQTTNEYTRCMATKTQFKNFALQVTMSIKGDAGGVIFRSNDTNGTYYRLAFNQSDPTTPKTDTYSVYLCSNSACDTATVDTGNVNTGTLLTKSNTTVQVDRTKPITFTIIVIDSNIDLYISNTLLAHISAIPTDTNSNTSILMPIPTPTPALTPTPTPTPTFIPTLTPTPASVPLSGYIGVYAADLEANTDVTFSNLKVWMLDTVTSVRQNNRRPNNR